MKYIYNGQKNCDIFSPIKIVANQPIEFGFEGSIELRRESKSGELIESFEINSNSLEIIGHELIITPTNPLPFGEEIIVLISNGFIVSSIGKNSFSQFSATGSKEFKFSTENPVVGKIINNHVIVSVYEKDYKISTLKDFHFKGTWNSIDDTIEQIEKSTNIYGWYIPSLHEIRSVIDVLNLNNIEGEYWTSIENDANNSFSIDISSGVSYIRKKETFNYIIAFKKN